MAHDSPRPHVSLRYPALVLWIALCVGGGALVGVVTAGGDSAWYQTLDKPEWTPPSWVFAPVWTTLYAMMGYAAWRVWRRGGWSRQTLALTAFAGQLALNFAWSLIFFGRQLVGWARVDILALWIAVALTIRLFIPVDRAAAWLLTPYLAWVTFATLLNFAIYRLQ
jgi:benzodiazapine receptor